MSRVLLECAFLILVTAWVLAEALALGRSTDRRPNSQLATNAEMGPAKDPRDLGFTTLVAAAMILLILLLVPGAVTSNGQSISLNEISDSVRASMDVGPAATFVSAWRAEYPLGFWG